MATKPLPAAEIEAHESIYETLMREGFCVLPDIMPTTVVESLARDMAPHFEATPFCEGGFYGSHTKRFGSLLKRSNHSSA